MNLSRKAVKLLILEHAMPLSIFFTISIYAFSSLLSGQVIAGNLIRESNIADYYKTFRYLWHDKGSFSSFATANQFTFYLPFFWTSFALNLNTSQMIALVAIFTEFLTGVTMYYSARYLLKTSYPSLDYRILTLSSFMAAFLYMWNPFIVYQSWFPYARISYALFPVILASLIRGLKQNYRYVMLCGFLWNLSCGDNRQILYQPLVLCSYIGYSFVLDIIREKKRVRDALATHAYVTAILFGSFVAFAAMWLLPGLLTVEHFTPYILTREEIDLLFRNAGSLTNVMAMQGYWIDRGFYAPRGLFASLVPQHVVLSLGVLIFIFAMIPLILKAANKFVLFFSVLLVVVVIPLTMGPHLFGESYYWLVFEAPLHNLYGWVFRAPKIRQFIPFFCSFLLGFTMTEIALRTAISADRGKIRKVTGILASTLMLSSIVLSGWPILTGDFNGVLKPTEVPQELINANSWLEGQTGDHKVLWLPTYQSYSAYWTDSPMMRRFDVSFSSKPTYYVYAGLAEVNLYSRNYFTYSLLLADQMPSLLRENRTTALGNVLLPMNVEYIVVHDDVSLLHQRVDKAIDVLKRQDDVRLVLSEGFTHIFENEHDSDPVFVPEQMYVVSDGLSKVTSLTSVDEFTLKDVGLVMSDLDPVNSYVSHSDGLILSGGNTESIVIKQADHKYIVSPFDFAFHGNPRRAWSVKGALDPSHGSWHGALESIGLENWEFDYQKGLVLADSGKGTKKHILEIPFDVEEDGRYALYVRCFRSRKGGEFSAKLDENPEKLIPTKGQIDGFVMVKIDDFPLKSGEHRLLVTNMEGFNSINLFILIPSDEYEKARGEVYDLTSDKRMVYILEAESELLKRRTVASNGFSGKASNGDVLRFGENGRAWREIDVLKGGTYRVALKGMGTYEVTVGDNSFILDSASLSATYTPAFSLSAGQHRIELAPLNLSNLVRGPSFEEPYSKLRKYWVFRAVREFDTNLDAEAKSGEYSLKISTQTTKSQKWSRIVSQPMDVESLKEYLITTHMKTYNNEAAHSKIEAYYPSEDRWRKLTSFVTREGTGDLEWQEHSEVVEIPRGVTKVRVVLNSGWVHNESKGEAIAWFDDIGVYKVDDLPVLDVIWIFSTDAKETVEDLFRAEKENAQVVSYQKIDPTHWEVEVMSTGSFVLCLAEAYDPSWRATVHQYGRIAEVVESMPLYSVVNGFWVNHTGNLRISIEYEPQKWFYYGSAISASTSLALLLYVLWDWGRRKYDWFGLKMISRLRRMLRG